MAVTPELINWLGIVLGLGNKLHRKVINGQNVFGVGNDCQWNSSFADFRSYLMFFSVQVGITSSLSLSSCGFPAPFGTPTLASVDTAVSRREKGADLVL